MTWVGFLLSGEANLFIETKVKLHILNMEVLAQEKMALSGASSFGLRCKTFQSCF